MNTPWKLALSAAALGLIALPVWLATRPSPVRSAPAKETTARAASPELESPPRTRPEPDPAPSFDRSAEALAPADPRAAAPVAAPVEAETRIEGRILDADQRPLSDGFAEVPDVRGARAACTGDGRFSVALGDGPTASELFALHVHAPVRATRVIHVRVEPHATVQVGDVVLAAGARVAGSVHTAAGDPAAGLRVVIARPSASASWSFVGGPELEPESSSVVTDAHGRFTADDAPTGLVNVWACRPGLSADEAERRSAWVCSEVFELAPGAVRDDVELVLPGEGTLASTAIAGVVLTPRGEPVPRASIRVEAESHDGTVQTNVAADELGRFLYDGQKACVADFLARDPEDAWRPVRASRVRSGEHEVELVLGEPRWLDVNVHDAAGRVPERFEVTEYRVLATRGNLRQRSREGGAGPLRLLAPIDPFLLEIECAGFELARLGPFEPDAVPAELECELVALPGLRGRVLHDGAPVSGARLELRSYPRADQNAEMQGFPQRVWCTAEESATSGADGRFLLSGRMDGERVLQCLADGFALAELGPLDVDPATGAHDLDFELLRGGTIEGTVRVAPGLDPAGVIGGANRFDAHPRTQRADEQGRFRFEHLTPGPWRIERVRREVDPTDQGFVVDEQREGENPRGQPNCTVADGETTAFELDLSGERPAQLSARLAVDGAIAAGWSIDLWPVGVNALEGELPGGRLDSEGRVSFETEPGRYWVRFHSPDTSDFDGVAKLELDLAPGETPLDASFETAALRGRWLDDPSGLYVVWIAETEAGYSARTYLALDADGRFQRDALLAGSGELVVQRRNGGAEVLRRALELPPGERVTIELP